MSRQVVPTAMLANLGVTSPKLASDLNVTHLGVNTTPASNDSLYVLGGPALTGGTQCGIEIGTTFGTQATAAGRAVECYVQTAAASFTMGQGAAIYADVPNLGAGSAITNQYGLYVANQGKAGITNAYGIYIANLSGASGTQWGLWNAGATRLANYTQIDGNLYIGGTIQFVSQIAVGQAPQSNVMFAVSGTVTGGVGSQVVFETNPNFPSTATTRVALYEGSVGTVAASFTIPDARGLSIVAPFLGAGSAITTIYGVYIGNQGAAGVTNAYGVYILAQSGASATNVALWNAGVSQLAGVVNVGDGNVGIIDVSRGSGSGGMVMAPNATWTPFGVGNNFSGMIVVDETIVSGRPAVFIIGGTVCTLIGDGSGGNFWSATQGTASRVNVYSDTANSYSVTIQNSTTNTLHVQVLGLRMRTQQ